MHRRSIRSLLLLIVFGFCLLWRGAPVQASAAGKVTAVLAGNRYSVVARDDGTLWGWGDNHFTAETGYRYSHPVPACAFDNVQQLAGYTEGLALKTDGTVWAWGAQQGATYCRQVTGLPTAVAVAASDTGSAVLAADGSVWQWPSVNGIPSLIAPAKVDNLPPAVAIAAGRYFTVAVANDGSVYTWGIANDYGQLGQGHFKAGPFGAQQVPGLSGITAVATSRDFTLALASDGTVWGWGRNLGMWDNTFNSAATPRHLSGLTDVAHIAAGTFTGAVTKTDGTVWLWGNIYHNSASLEPVQVPGLTGAAALSLGYDHLLALMPDGSVLAYGDNYYYELGTGDTVRYEEPVTPLPFALDLEPPTWVNGQVIAEPGEGFIRVSPAGATDDYAVVGYDLYVNDRLTEINLPVRYAPWTVGGLATDADYTVRLEAIDASGRKTTNGPTATVRTLPDKTPPIWGNPLLNAYTIGQTGMRLVWNPAYGAELGGYRIYANGELMQDVPHQNRSDMQTDITGLTPDTDYQIQVQAYDMYKNESTNGPTVSVHTLPVRNAAATAAAGTYYGLVAGINGDVWGWGDNRASEISPGAQDGIYQRPFVVPGATDITAVSAGLAHTLALRGDGTVWSWGASANGRLGRDPNPYPKFVGYVPNLTNGVSVAAGCYHSLAARADGTVWAWGYNANRQLGDGTTTDQSSPVQVKNLSDVTSVAAGCNFSLALKSDGTVWMWGAMSPGTSGASAPASPTRVGSLTNVVAIAAGAGHALAVTADGSVWAWGINTAGQLGDGSTTNRWTPVKVSGLSGVSSAAAGASHSMALKSDGSVWAWGDNSVGQIGDGMPGGIRKAPVRVAVQPVTAIASGSGSYTSLAVGADGAIWAWGAGDRGQLGDDLTHGDYSAIPVQVRFPGADTTPPTWPDDSALSAPSMLETELTLSWTDALDETAIGFYQIFQNDTLVATVPGETTSYTVKGLQGKSAYQFRVAASDLAGNWTSGPSLAVTTPGKDAAPPGLALGQDGMPVLKLALKLGDEWVAAPATSITAKSITFDGLQADAYAIVGQATEPLQKVDAKGTTGTPVIEGDRFSVPFTPTGAGSVTLNLTLYDLSGNKTALPAVTIRIPAGPAAKITDPTKPSVLVGATGNLTVKGTVGAGTVAVGFINADDPGEVFPAEVTLTKGTQFTANVHLPADTDRVIRLRVVARNADGLLSLPDAKGADMRTVTLDTTAPQAPTIDSPAQVDFTIRTTAASLKLQGKSEPLSIVTATGVGAKPVSATADKNGAYTLTLTLPEGESYLNLAATDAAGNQSDWIARTIIRDSKAPVIAGAQATYDNAAGHWVSTATTAALKVQMATSYDVVLTLNEPVAAATVGGSTAGVTAPAPTQVAFTLNGLKKGANSTKVEVTDTFGNTAKITLTVTVDADPPKITLSSPVQLTIGAPAQDGAPITYTFTGTANEALQRLDVLDAQTGAPVDLVVVAEVNAKTPTKWTAKVTFPNEIATYGLRFAGTDLAGNVSTAGTKDAATVKVDPFRPVISLPCNGCDENGWLFTDGDDPDLNVTNKVLTVAGTASDEGLGVRSVTVGKTKQSPKTPAPTFDFSVPVTLKEGKVVPISITADDAAGNVLQPYVINAVLKSTISRLTIAKPTASRTLVTISGSTDAAIKVGTEYRLIVPLTITVTGKKSGQVYTTHLDSSSHEGYDLATGTFRLSLAMAWQPDDYTVTVTAEAPLELPGIASKPQTATFTVK